MALFQWTKDYSVGVNTLDGHHQKLFDIMNKLYDIADDKSAQGLIGPLLGELIQYTEYHFGEEERLMEQAGYSGLSKQRLEHKSLVDKLKEAKDKITNNPNMSVFVVADISMTATDWLKAHILKLDKAYESTLVAAGCR
jgi:hemerythrin